MIDPTAIPPSFVGALSSSYVGNLSRSLAQWWISQISPAYVEVPSRNLAQWRISRISPAYVRAPSRNLAQWRISQISPAYVGNLFIMLLYVCGVVLLIYSLMQLVHGLEAKDKEYTRRGFLFLLISIVLLLTRPMASLLF